VTILGHAVSGIAAYGALRKRGAPPFGMTRRLAVWIALVLPMLPDLDTFTGQPYGSPLGHRGVLHSWGIAIAVGVLLALALQRLGRIAAGRRALAGASILFSAFVGSHGVIDAMTNGGEPIPLFWPLTMHRYWLPWRPIPVSPFGSSLVRTEWSRQQLRIHDVYRRRMLASDAPAYLLVRDVLRLSDRPDHARRLVVLGVALSEIVLVSPLLVVALVRFWREPRAPAPPAEARAPPDPAPARPPNLVVAAIALGATLAALAVALALEHAAFGGVRVDSGHFDDPNRPPFVRVRPKARDDGPVAVLVHGWRCSHQMMLPLARMLARNGVTAYAVDLPGHAASPVPMDLSCSERAVRPCRRGNDRFFVRFTNEILGDMDRAGIFRRPVVVIGHSTGGIAAHDAHGPAAQKLAARIDLEGTIRTFLRGGNRLVIGNARHVRLKGEPDVRFGNFEDKSAYMLFTSKTTHLDLVRSARVNGAILRWIRGATGMRVGRDTAPHFHLVQWTAALAGGFGLALYAFALALARRRGLVVAGAPISSPRPVVATFCVVLGSLAAALAAGEEMREGQAWLLASMGQSAPVYLRAAATWVALPYVVFAFRPTAPDASRLARDVLLGMLAFLALYATLGVAVDRTFFHVGITPVRLGPFLAWTAFFVPVSLVVGEVGPSGSGIVRPLLALGARLAAWYWVFAVHAVGRMAYHQGELFGLAAVAAVAEVVALPLLFQTRSRLARAVLVAALLAWLQTTSYPLLASATVTP
jgi:inner membrane protein